MGKYLEIMKGTKYFNVHIVKNLLLLIIIFGFFTLITTGCATHFKGNNLAEITKFPPEDITDKKSNNPSVYVDITWHRALGSQKTKFYNEVFVNQVIAVTNKSALFSEVSRIKATKNQKDYQIYIDMLNYGNLFGLRFQAP